MKTFRRLTAVILACLLLLAGCGQSVSKWQEQYDLGLRYLSESNYEEAIIAFTAAIEIDPKQAPAYVGRGSAYVLLEETEENCDKAQADFRQALSLDKLLVEAWLCLADVLIRTGDFALALATLQDALEALGSDQQVLGKLAEFDAGEITDSSGLLRGIVIYDAEGNPTGYMAAVHASTPWGLKGALGSNVLIVLDGKDYDVGELNLYGLENLIIQGTENTRLVSSSGMDTIFMIMDSKGVTLRNLTIGHDVPVGASCPCGVLYMDHSEVTFENCDIFGCGMYGFYAYECAVRMRNSTIRDCAWNILSMYNSSGDFQDCRFSGNGYDDPSWYAMEIYGGGEEARPVVFQRCAFENNTADYLTQEDTGTASCTFEDCTFSGNSWQG